MAADNFIWFPTPATGGLLQGGGDQPSGESTDAWFGKGGTLGLSKPALECLSFSFGVSQAETTGSYTTGAGAGKVKFEEFQIEKYVDTASCPLYNACTAGAHFPAVMLACRKAGGTPLLYLQYCFRMVFVTGINWSGGGGEEQPKETIKFKFAALGIQYIQQLPTGGVGTTMSAMWSLAGNKPTLDVTGLGPAPQYLKSS
jgi:type VI secretion system secreted protein Hcp